MRPHLLLATVCVAATAAAGVPAAGAVPVPRAARAVDSSRPDQIVADPVVR